MVFTRKRKGTSACFVAGENLRILLRGGFAPMMGQAAFCSYRGLLSVFHIRMSSKTGENVAARMRNKTIAGTSRTDNRLDEFGEADGCMVSSTRGVGV
jgi:hypothetical protein